MYLNFLRRRGGPGTDNDTGTPSVKPHTRPRHTAAVHPEHPSPSAGIPVHAPALCVRPSHTSVSAVYASHTDLSSGFGPSCMGAGLCTMHVTATCVSVPVPITHVTVPLPPTPLHTTRVFSVLCHVCLCGCPSMSAHQPPRRSVSLSPVVTGGHRASLCTQTCPGQAAGEGVASWGGGRLLGRGQAAGEGAG